MNWYAGLGVVIFLVGLGVVVLVLILAKKESFSSATIAPSFAEPLRGSSSALTAADGCLRADDLCLVPWSGGGSFKTPSRSNNVLTPSQLDSFIFVSSSKGSDSNRGDAPDVPFKTLAGAVAAAASKNGKGTGIVLLDPVHELSSTLEIGKAAGKLIITSHPRAASSWGCPIPAAPDAPALPQISGAANVTLTFEPPDARGVRKTNIKSLGLKGLRVCWCDGVRVPRSRTGFLKLATDAGSFLCPDFGAGGPGEALIADQWSYARNKINIPANGARVNTDTELILDRPRMKPSVVWIESSDPSSLTLAGMHAYDATTGDFYYLPPKARKGAVNSAVFSFPKITEPTIIRVRNAKDVVFDSFRISHASWEFGQRIMTQQANVTKDWDMFPASIEVETSSNIVFVNCVLDHLGGASGVWFKPGSSSCAVFNSIVRDIGGSGIVIGQVAEHGGAGAEGNTVENCDISSIGVEHPSCVGIFMGYVAESLISQNSIHDISYSGISCGWGWGDGSEKHRANQIVKNELFNFGTVLTDCGAIYCLSNQNNGLWAENYAHDGVMGSKMIAHSGRICFSFYADNGTSSLTWRNNLTGTMPKQYLEHEFVQHVAEPFATVNKEPKTMTDEQIKAGAGAKGLLK